MERVKLSYENGKLTATVTQPEELLETVMEHVPDRQAAIDLLMDVLADLGIDCDGLE